jgi:putative IMPACT (imprinted ancient) family translation regulator
MCRQVLEELYQNKKIAHATHNMYAYRIYKADTKCYIQDCSDDGEAQAGGRLLHLLQVGCI